MATSEKTTTPNTTTVNSTRCAHDTGATEILNRLAVAESCLQQLTETQDTLAEVSRNALLDELHPDTAFLNRTYLREVQARSLKVVPEILDWCGYRVRVFLPP